MASRAAPGDNAFAMACGADDTGSGWRYLGPLEEPLRLPDGAVERRQTIPKHLPVSDLPEDLRPDVLLVPLRLFMDFMRIIAWCSETRMIPAVASA